jgi:hypothetical protein
MGITLAQIGADLLKDAIIIEQRIELRDYWLDSMAQLGHQLEYIDGVIVIT